MKVNHSFTLPAQTPLPHHKSFASFSLSLSSRNRSKTFVKCKSGTESARNGEQFTQDSGISIELGVIKVWGSSNYKVWGHGGEPAWRCVRWDRFLLRSPLLDDSWSQWLLMSSGEHMETSVIKQLSAVARTNAHHDRSHNCNSLAVRSVPAEALVGPTRWPIYHVR